MMPNSEDYLKTLNAKYSGRIPDNESKSIADFFTTAANNLACILLREGKTPAVFTFTMGSRALPVCVADGKAYDPRMDRPESFTNYVKRESVRPFIPASDVPDWLESA